MRMTKLALIAVVATGVVSAGLSTVEHLDNEIVELDEAAFEVFETASYAQHITKKSPRPPRHACPNASPTEGQRYD